MLQISDTVKVLEQVDGGKPAGTYLELRDNVDNVYMIDVSEDTYNEITDIHKALVEAKTIADKLSV